MDETLNTVQGMKHVNPPTGIGARLKSAREAARLTEKEAASRLHLNPRFIAMMETESFDGGLPDTFIRGYLRSYGRLLNLNEQEVNAAIGQLNLSSPNTASALALPTPTVHVNQLDRYLRWTSYVIISSLFLLVIIWWASHPRYNEADALAKSETPTLAPLPVEATASQTTAPVTTPTMATNQTTVAQQPGNKATTSTTSPSPVQQTAINSTQQQPVSAITKPTVDTQDDSDEYDDEETD